MLLLQWEELYATKPDDDYEDPADVAAIKEAKDNMGDYKLKTAKDYVVPDHLRMNVDKARGRLLVLKDLVGIGTEECTSFTCYTVYMCQAATITFVMNISCQKDHLIKVCSITKINSILN